MFFAKGAKATPTYFRARTWALASPIEICVMSDIKIYISKRMVNNFSRKLPVLRKATASIPINNMEKGYGVSGNTFRAFTGWKKRPSDVYRAWAQLKTTKLTVNFLREISRSRKKFLCWHEKLVRSLQRYWKKEQGECLSIAHSRKCVDAYVAWITRHDFGNPNVSVSLEKVANCLLDKQTLKNLNVCYSNALPIGKNPSMGHISHVETYSFCQDLIADFARKAGGSRLLFDRFGYRKGNG